MLAGYSAVTGREQKVQQTVNLLKEDMINAENWKSEITTRKKKSPSTLDVILMLKVYGMVLIIFFHLPI